MSSDARADRNLLFGVLALQMDFIDRDTLIAAMNAWVLEKSTPLGRLLVSQGKLAADEHELLEALVQKHLSRHGNDAEKSLAAVSSVGSVKQDLAQIADAELEKSLRHVTAAPHEDPYATAVCSVGEPSTSGLRFRVLRPHARGGLGQVSVARDEELHREVALKEIQPRHADDRQSRARFLLEAEITGGLEHPGIVPVYGLGTYADGRPFYAMRFIRGDSLKDAIERFYRPGRKRDAGETTLELRQLLGRLIDVCNAIEYAHCRGVLHRDLKPGNIMLGKYGETLVVDWGLAKPVDRPDSIQRTGEQSLKPVSASGTAPTMLGSAVGTPQYMSPEQAAGRHSQVGPASDVYSLGATLFCILTGRAPFPDGDLGETLQRVMRGEFDRPRAINSQIPAALEAICLKAMAVAPEERYASPLAMADDLEHWLADEPVVAYRERAAERASRWLRRHRAWAQAAAIALVVISGVSLAAALLVNRARQQEIVARQQEEEARREAQRQYELAEASFVQARRAVDDFFTRVSETDLLDAPGMQPLRQELLDVALQYDQEFVKTRGDDPSMQRELAAAWFRLGWITWQIDSQAKAAEMFQKARGIQEQLLSTSPTDAELQLALSNTYNELGRLSLHGDDAAAAQELFQKALELRSKLAQQKPQAEEYARKLASSYMNLSIAHHAQGELQKAIEGLRKANSVRQRLVDRQPEVALFRRDLARGYYNLGIMQVGSAAVESLQKAVQLFTRLAAEEPLVMEYRRELGRSLWASGRWKLEMDDLEGGSDELRRALELTQRLAADNPELNDVASDLALIYSDLAVAHRRQDGDIEAALEQAQKAVEIFEKLAQANPAVQQFSVGLANARLFLGETLLHMGQPGEALPILEQGREVYKRLQQSDPESANVGHVLASSWNSLGTAQYNQNQPQEARASYEEAQKLLEPLAQRQPDDPKLHDDLTNTYRCLGALAADDDKPAEALQWYEKAKTIHVRFSGPSGGDRDHREHLVNTLRLIGALEMKRGRHSEAVAAYEEAEALATRLAEDHPRSKFLQELHDAARSDKEEALKAQNGK